MARTAWAKLTDKQKVAAMTALPNHIQYWKQKETDTAQELEDKVATL